MALLQSSRDVLPLPTGKHTANTAQPVHAADAAVRPEIDGILELSSLRTAVPTYRGGAADGQADSRMSVPFSIPTSDARRTFTAYRSARTGNVVAEVSHGRE